MNKNSIIKKQFILFAFLAKMTKLVKLLKFGKIFLTFATMCLSAFIYSFSMGAWFSIGFVVLLFVHEMGHVIALRFKGLPASAPVFIPFIGAAIFSPSFKGKENESFVGIGGPLLGGVSCLVMFALWKTTPGHPNILLMLSYTATVINLFNLIPLRPLDGGRITQIIGPWFKYIGLGALLIVSFFIREPSMFFIWVIVLSELKINKILRACLGLACELAMIIFMCMGYSHQPSWVNAFDIAIVSLVNVALIFTMISEIRRNRKFKSIVDTLSPEQRKSYEEFIALKIKNPEIEEDVSRQTRLKWLVNYIVLSGALALLFFYQTPFLPRH